MHAVGAGLPDQLALELGQPVELVAVRGSSATPARVNLYRRAARNPDYWRNRRWVVWCLPRANSPKATAGAKSRCGPAAFKDSATAGADHVGAAP